jgi:hypothetical protein
MGSSESKTYSTSEQFPKLDNVYYPLANGGRPFRVRLENNNAYIDKDKRWDIDLDDKDYDKIWSGLPKWELIMETPYIKSFVGKEDPKNPSCPDVGSSVLLQINNNTYIYIGIIITELIFKEKIKEFFTETGCSNTVDSWIYTSKYAIDPLFGIKYPIKVFLKGKYPGDLTKEDFKKYENNKVEIKTLHDFVL